MSRIKWIVPPRESRGHLIGDYEGRRFFAYVSFEENRAAGLHRSWHVTVKVDGLDDKKMRGTRGGKTAAARAVTEYVQGLKPKA